MVVVRTVGMTTNSDGVVITIEGPDGDDEVSLPEPLLELLSEGGESSAEVVSDIVVLSCAERIHAIVHHGEDELGDELASVEDDMMERFEERFGVSFAEATGHDH